MKRPAKPPPGARHAREAPHEDGTRGVPFAEGPAWKSIGEGWRPLFGNVSRIGFSFEWHDFTCGEALDWARSFHPGTIELCLNLTGRAVLTDPMQSHELLPQTLAFYHQGNPPLAAVRRPAERHRFITVEFSRDFLIESLAEDADSLHPSVRRVVQNEQPPSFVTAPERLATALLTVVETLRHPPVFARAQAVWFRCKAVELAAQLFFRPPDGELFCTRAQRVGRERVERARFILRERMSNAPSLEELGRLVGCSPFYLSRLFSQEAGMTIQQYVRRLRLERAAELLRSGKCNVTEAAFEVGYNSLSHFSTAFYEMFGCCPGLYPMQTKSQCAKESLPQV